MRSKLGFTLIELLVVIAIIGGLSAIGLIVFNNVLENSKIAATKENHNNIANLVKTKSVMCKLNDTIEYKDINGNSRSINCKPSINQFVSIMNQSVYGMSFESPFNSGNPSWCKINVTNCSPPGFMSACPSHVDQAGYLSIFKYNNTTIRVCSNLGTSTGSTKYMQTDITYY